MKNVSAILGPATIIVVSWALPLYSLAHNRAAPSYESALGVAYGFLIGCVIHGILVAAWFVIRRANIRFAEVAALTLSLIALIALAALSDGGALSQVGA